MRYSLGYIKDNYNHPLIGVEVGVHNGVNLKNMLDNMNLNTLFAVDIWGKYDEHGTSADTSNELYNVYKNFMFDDRLKIVHLDSAQASTLFEKRSLDFVYIDDNHNEDKVVEGITDWLPKVKIGGVLCGHDWGDNGGGVVNAVNRVLGKEYKIDSGSEIGLISSQDWMIIKKND